MTASARVKEHEELARELRKRVAGPVRFDSVSRVLYSTDASIYQMEPIGVVMPRSREDVLAVMEIAAGRGVPVLPRGGGTSLSGQAVNHAIVMDFSRHMNQVLEVNADERWARVQPGVVLDQLNKQVAPLGLQFAPDPTTANRACIGGAIGNNTCGTHSVVYGKTIDHVLELQTVLSDGTEARFSAVDQATLEAKVAGVGLEADIYRRVRQIAQENGEEIAARYPKIMRRVSGYNLDDFVPSSSSGSGGLNMARMVVGSEGTLCVVTEAKVNLVPLPPKKALAVLHFDDLARACEATMEILPHQPAAIELIGRMILDRCRESLGFARLMGFVEGEPDAILAIEFSGESDAEAEGKVDALCRDASRKGLGYACVRLTGAAQADVWSLRTSGLGLLMSTRGDSKPLPFVEDTAVDPGKMGDYVRRFDEVVKAHGSTAGYYGHASVGCLHIRPLVNLKTRDGLDKMVSIASDISDLVLEFGGSLSGEHGDGIVRGVWMEKMFGSQIYEAFREVKRAFDPQNIMNPGKIIDCPPMTENLRLGEGYQTKTIDTKLDFSADHGFAGAVEMCNGMGACRKDGGTMCPSYMATREEEHSTRGRANLLRAVLSGALPGEGLASKKLYDALDLCLECKACKSECQTGVDMTKLKYEFLDKYAAAHGTSWRSRIFANINTLSRLGSRFAPLSNMAAANPLSKFALHRFFGVHRRRSLPRFASQSFPQWSASRSPDVRGGSGSVVLFNDTFMNYNYPQIGIAATEVLERAGFHVTLANPVCCGRPMLSKGFLDTARDHARRNVDMLYSYAEKGVPIIGCEPSCLLTLRDEYPDLLSDDKAKAVASNSYLVDEFLSTLQEQGKLKLEFTDLKKKVLFHGHCHQKALIGSRHSVELLKMPPGYEVEEVQAGCCGMAGSFGFEKEHYEISMAIGGEQLFPAVEAKGYDWEIAVTGVSCRQQLEHGTSRRPRHLIEVLRDAVE